MTFGAPLLLSYIHANIYIGIWQLWSHPSSLEISFVYFHSYKHLCIKNTHPLDLRFYRIASLFPILLLFVSFFIFHYIFSSMDQFTFYASVHPFIVFPVFHYSVICPNRFYLPSLCQCSLFFNWISAYFVFSKLFSFLFCNYLLFWVFWLLFALTWPSQFFYLYFFLFFLLMWRLTGNLAEESADLLRLIL